MDHYERLLAEREPQLMLLRVRAVDALGLPAETVRSGDDLRVEVLLRAPGGVSTAGIVLQLDLLDDDGTHLFGTQVELPDQLAPAALASRRGDDEPDTRMAGGVIRSLPLASGAVHLAATLLSAGETLDHQETVLQVEPAGFNQRGMLALEHEWAWQSPALDRRDQAPARR
jgi:hypothetical protein